MADLSGEGPGEPERPLFLGPDKNLGQIKTEVGAKQLAAILRDLYLRLQWRILR